MDVDVAERHFLHEVQAHHHHAGDPEEDDVEAGDENVGRVVALQLRRLVRPAEGRERPQRRGEPGVEHVLVARRARRSCRTASLASAAASPPPRRRRPCRRARTTPGSDGPTRAGARRTRAGCSPSNGSRCSPSSSGTNTVRPRFTASMAGFASVLASTYHWSVRQRLDDDVRAVAMRHGVDVRLDLLDQALRLQPRNDRLARGEAVEPVQFLNRRISSGLGSTPWMKSGLPSSTSLRLGARGC